MTTGEGGWARADSSSTAPHPSWPTPPCFLVEVDRASNFATHAAVPADPLLPCHWGALRRGLGSINHLPFSHPPLPS
jgi:hypothetical protein